LKREKPHIASTVAKKGERKRKNRSRHKPLGAWEKEETE